MIFLSLSRAEKQDVYISTSLHSSQSVLLVCTCFPAFFSSVPPTVSLPFFVLKMSFLIVKFMTLSVKNFCLNSRTEGLKCTMKVPSSHTRLTGWNYKCRIKEVGHHSENSLILSKLLTGITLVMKSCSLNCFPMDFS